MLAFRKEEVMISTDDFNCPECGAPLVPADGASKVSVKLLVGLMVGFVALIGAVLVFGGISQFAKLKKSDAVPNASASPSATATPKRVEAPVVKAEPFKAAPTEVPVVKAEVVKLAEAVPQDLNLQKKENSDVRTEVLKRIDLMPNITAENKDKLYMSVERARQMGRVVIIPFGSGKSSLSSVEIDGLKKAVATPNIQELMQDPTVVFVVLGYADTKGDEKKNLAISEVRAQAVMNAMRDQCGVANVMHSVGMGGSTLFDPSGTEKNRVAEIWAVLP